MAEEFFLGGIKGMFDEDSLLLTPWKFIFGLDILRIGA